jgi:hypothetical protein
MGRPCFPCPLQSERDWKIGWGSCSLTAHRSTTYNPDTCRVDNGLSDQGARCPLLYQVKKHNAQLLHPAYVVPHRGIAFLGATELKTGSFSEGSNHQRPLPRSSIFVVTDCRNESLDGSPPKMLMLVNAAEHVMPIKTTVPSRHGG